MTTSRRSSALVALVLGCVVALITLAPILNGPVTGTGTWSFTGSVIMPHSLTAGLNHTIAIVGDSIAADTPYQTIPQQGTAWQLQNLFAENTDYTQTTGSDLGPSAADTEADDFNITNGTYTPATRTIALTPQAATFGANTWKARAVYCPNSGGGCAGVNDGINISAYPTSRYLLSYEVDTTALAAGAVNAAAGAVFAGNNAGGGSVTATGSSITNDTVMVRPIATAACSSEEPFIFAGELLNGSNPPSLGFRDRKWAKYYVVLDPTNWGWSGANLSVTGKFGDNSCRIQLEFDVIAGKSESAITVAIRNVTLKRLTYGVAVRRYGAASQTLEGWWEDDYPTLKTLLKTGKTYPLDAILNLGGRNSYDGQSGTYSGGASTLTSFFSTLDAAKTTLATDSVAWVQALILPSKRVPDTTSIYAGQGDAAAEGWRLMQRDERDWLRSNSIPFIDTLRLWEWSNEYLNMTTIIDGAEMPGAGASIIVPIGVSPVDQSGKAFYAQLASTVATSGSTSGNRWCFQLLNRSATACAAGAKAGSICVNNVDCPASTCTAADPSLSTAAACTDAGELSLSAAKSVTVNQNYNVGRSSVLALKITRTGTPTAIAATDFLQITVQIAQGYWNSENTYMFDDQHPSSMGYRAMAEEAYSRFTGVSVGKKNP